LYEYFTFNIYSKVLLEAELLPQVLWRERVSILLGAAFFDGVIACFLHCKEQPANFMYFCNIFDIRKALQRATRKLIYLNKNCYI